MLFHIEHLEDNDLKPSSFLQVNACGLTHLQKEITISRLKGRSDYQLIYLLSGHFEASYEDVNHHFTQGFVLYPPHTPQEYTDFQDTKRIWVHFTGHNIEEILQDAKLECGVHPIAFSPIIQKMLLQLIAEHTQIRSVSSEKGLFLYILYLLGIQQNNINSPSDEIHDAITYITAHFSQKLHIEELAASCNLSPSHFMYLFKKQAGMSPLAYQQALRIENAKSSLVSTQFSINEIAEQVGYLDPLYFSRVFKKVTGLSPKDFRKKYTQEKISN